jgi:hypothetical protein
MGCFKHSGCKNCEPHDPRLISRVRSGDRAADSRICDEAHENKEGEDNRSLVSAITRLRAGRAAPRRDEMGRDHTEGKNDRYCDA